MRLVGGRSGSSLSEFSSVAADATHELNLSRLSTQIDCAERGGTDWAARESMTPRQTAVELAPYGFDRFLLARQYELVGLLAELHAGRSDSDDVIHLSLVRWTGFECDFTAVRDQERSRCA